MTRRGLAWTVIGGGVLLAVVYLGSASTIFFAAAALPLAIAALGQDLVLNRAGQASFGGAAMLAVGAFTIAGCQNIRWLPFPLPLVVAALAGGVVGVIIGLPGVRIGGLYLLLSTLALQAFVAYSTQEIQHNEIAGTFINQPHLGSLIIAPGSATLVLNAVVLLIICVLLGNLYRVDVGRAWQAVRENELAARVMGLPTVRWKLLAFVVSSMVTSVAGGLYAYTTGNVSSGDFDLALAIEIVVMVYIGGRRTLVGPIIGALFVSYCPLIIGDIQKSSWMPSTAAQWLVLNGGNVAIAVYAFLLLVVFLSDPDGLAGLAQAIVRQLSRLVRSMGHASPVGNNVGAVSSE
jgi:branched-chain amino acid transport system permease protein